MASQRTLELVIAVSNQASEELQRIKAELQSFADDSSRGRSDKTSESMKDAAKSANAASKSVNDYSDAAARSAEESRKAAESVGIFGRALQGIQAIGSAFVGVLEGIAKIIPKVLAVLALLPQSNKIFEAGINQIGDAVGKLSDKLKELSANTSNKLFGNLAQTFGGITGKAAEATKVAGAFVGALPPETIRAIAATLGLISPALVNIVSGGNDAEKTLQKLGEQGKNSNGIGGLAFAFNNIVQAVQTLAGVAKSVYDPLIGSNEKLNAQLLSSQTNLASSTKIFKDGIEITDPTEKIKATEDALRASLKQIEKDTTSLVGVTSEQVNELFQITLTNAAELNNQSKQFPGPIEAATSLTKGWAASLKVIGVPLDQARQEITSILKGQIDNNSVLAKNLNLTNDQVSKYKAQGILVDELNKRLETFVAGNAIAARSIEGIGSNILDYAQQFAREVGKPLLNPIIDGLAEVEKFFAANKEAAIAFGQSITTRIANAFSSLGPIALNAFKQIQEVLSGNQGGFTAIFNNLEQTFSNAFEAVSLGFNRLFSNVDVGSIFQAITNGLKAISELAKTATVAIQPLVEVIGEGVGTIAQSFANLLNGDQFNQLIQNIQGGLKTVSDFISRFFEGLFSSVNFDGLLQGIAGIVSRVIETVKNVASALAPVSEAIGQALGSVIKVVGDFLNNYGPALTNFFGGLISAIAGLASGPLVILVRGFQGLVEIFGFLVNNPVVAGFFSGLLNILGELGKVIGYVGSVAGELTQAIINLVTFVGGTAIKAITDFAGAIGNLFGPVINTVGSAIDALKNAVASSFEGLIGTVSGVIEKIVNNPAFQAIAKVLKINLDDIKGSIGELKDAQPGVAEGLNKTAEAIKATGNAAKDASGKLTIQGKGAQELGTEFEQLAKRAENAQRILNDPGAKSEDLKNAAKQLIDATKAQLEAGTISQEEAQKRLEAVRNNTKLDVETQQAAAKEITAAKKDALDDQIRDIDGQITEVAAKAQEGKISQVQAAEETTKLKKQQLDLQLADLDKAIAAEKAAIARGSGSKERLEDLERQQKKANTELQKITIEGEQRVQDERLKIIERAEKKAQDIAKEAETQRNIQIQKLVNAGTIDKEKANFRRLQSTRQTIDAELKAEQASLAQLSKLPKQSNPEAKEKRQQAIRQSRLRTSELTLKQLESEKSLQEALTRVIQKKIDREVQGQKNILEASKQTYQKQVDLQQALLSILEQQQKLLGARSELQKSLNDLSQSQYSNAIKLLEGIGSEEERQRQRQKDGFQDRLSALEIEQKLKRKYTEEERTARVAAIQQELLNAGGVENERTKALKEELGLLEQLGDINAKQKQQEREDQIRNLKIEAKKAEIAAAEQEFKIQEQSLALEQQKTKILNEQEQVKLRIQAIEAKAATAQAQAELAKATVDKNSTPEQLRALQLAVQASQLRESGVAQQQQLQSQSAQAQDALFANQRQVLQSQQAVKRSGLQSDLAQLTPGTQDDEALLNQQAASAKQTAEASQQAGDSLKNFADQLDQTTEQLKQGVQPSPGVPNTSQPIAAQVLAQPLTGQQVAPLQNDLNPLTEQFRNMPQNVSNQLARINTPMAGTGAIDSSPIADFAGEILGAIEGLTNAVVNGFSNASMGNATFNLQSKNLIADGADLYARVQRSRFAAQGL